MSRWRPSQQQLDSPEKLQMAFKQLLDQHYALVDAHASTVEQLKSAQATVARMQQGPGRGNGPADSVLLGVLVQPADFGTLADGATLKWDKKSGTLKLA